MEWESVVTHEERPVKDISVWSLWATQSNTKGTVNDMVERQGEHVPNY